MCFKILFKDNEPLSGQKIYQAINEFGSSYNRTVRRIIQTTEGQKISKRLFIDNSTTVLNNFKMTRQGTFKGLGFNPDGNVIGPVKKLYACWDLIGSELIEMKTLLNSWGMAPHERILVLINDTQLQIITDKLYAAFKNILPVTMSPHSYGLVGASKILFAVLPEIVLPVDNAEWRKLFQTVDLGDVIRLMAKEIKAWESKTGLNLNECDHTNVTTTLPAVYNVMAMKARP